MRILYSFILALGLILAVQPVLAAGGGGGSSWSSEEKADPNFTAGTQAIDAKDWARAVTLFQKVVTKDDQNADAFNYLGFAQRNLGDYESAFKSYAAALAIDPKHRGAHEYIGEAYLQTGNLAKAEQHLGELDRICFFGCEEYRELKEKIAAYKSKNGKSS